MIYQTMCKWDGQLVREVCEHAECLEAYKRGFCCVDCMKLWDMKKAWDMKRIGRVA